MLAAGFSHTPHKAPRGAQHYARRHDTLPCLRRAPATHRTKHPEGHNTTQGCMTHCHACGGHQPHTAQGTPRGTTLHKAASMTHRHACGGHQPHTAQSTLRGTTLHKAARHNAMLAAGISHTPHKAPRGAQHYARRHDTLPCLRRAPATHRTKHPEGHNTTQGCMTHCHACGGHQPHTAQSTPRGTTLHKAASMTHRHACGGHQPHTAQSTLRGTRLHKAARHNAMLAAGFSHTPHKAPRGAQHYTRLHDTLPCLRRAPATHRTKHPEGHNTTQGSKHDTPPCLRRAPATHRTKHPEGHKTTQGCTSQRHACGGLQPHTAQSAPRGTTLHKAA